MEKVMYMGGEKVTLWMNLYRAGWFHREGKAGTVDVHPGDFYLTEAKARADMEPPEFYVATTSFEFVVPQGMILVENPAESEPTPLSVSRRRFVMKMVEEGKDISKLVPDERLRAAMIREPAVA